MSNLPSGADKDPLAPWNQPSRLCRYCDKDIIEDQMYRTISADESLDEDQIEEYVDVELYKFPLCEECAKEEYYDNDDDY